MERIVNTTNELMSDELLFCCSPDCQHKKCIHHMSNLMKNMTHIRVENLEDICTYDDYENFWSEIKECLKQN